MDRSARLRLAQVTRKRGVSLGGPSGSGVVRAARPRVLVVVYDAWLRDELAEVLSTAGCDVVRASNGATALRLSRSHACGLILLAPALPELSGPRLLDALHAEPTTRSSPIVVVGHADWLHTTDCQSVKAVIQYPCTSAEILNSVGPGNCEGSTDQGSPAPGIGRPDA